LPTGNRSQQPRVPQQQSHRTELPEACAGNQTPKLPPPTGLVHRQQCHRTVCPEDHGGNQALECQLPAGFVVLTQQQLLWLLEAHTPTQVDSKVSAAWWAPDTSNPLAMLSHRYPQFAIQCQSLPPCEPQAPSLANLLVPRGFHPHRSWKPSTPHCS
jgi:hypothetical protein